MDFVDKNREKEKYLERETNKQRNKKPNTNNNIIRSRQTTDGLYFTCALYIV